MLGFCHGSDRFYAIDVPAKPPHGPSVTIVDSQGRYVVEVLQALPTDPLERVKLLRIGPGKMDIGEPDKMNLDLRDDKREERVHVLGVSGNEKAGYSVELSDGSVVPWDVWNREVSERVNG